VTDCYQCLKNCALHHAAFSLHLCSLATCSKCSRQSKHLNTNVWFYQIFIGFRVYIHDTCIHEAYVPVFLYACIHEQICMHALITYIHTYTHTRIHPHTHTCMHKHTHTHTQRQTNANTRKQYKCGFPHTNMRAHRQTYNISDTWIHKKTIPVWLFVPF